MTDPAERWAALFYLCGHYDRADDRDPFLPAMEEICRVGATAAMSAAVYLDLESGAQRVALREGEVAQPEHLGAVNSGDPRTLEQFLGWAFDAVPARKYILVMAGLGILDSDSVVGRPPFDAERLFAICDDRATDDAIELHELGATLRSSFPPDGRRRLVMLACDMYAMQFMEVAYELRGVADVMLGIQADERHQDSPVRHWPYARLLQAWQEIVAAPPAGAAPRWRSGRDAHAATLGTQSVTLLSGFYGAGGDEAPVTISAIDLTALVPLAQALDTFSVVYLQWLSNDVIWRAREDVVSRQLTVLEAAWSYDLAQVADAIREALERAAAEAPARWGAAALPRLSYPRLSRMLRVLGSAAVDGARAGGPHAEAGRRLAGEMTACRSSVERVIAVANERDSVVVVPSEAEIERMVRGLFIEDGEPERVRDPEAWRAIVAAARPRVHGQAARDLDDVFDGIEAAGQLGRLAQRAADLARGVAATDPPAVLALWPSASRCGISLYRPIDLAKLAHSNYLKLRFSRELHWTALLTAIDLIKHHARLLWRLLESQLTAAPLEARYQLMRRLAGDRALTGRHAAQLAALSAPDAVFLTIEPTDVEAQGEHRTPATEDPVATYCVRLFSLDRSASVIERHNPVTRTRLRKVLDEIDAIGADVTADPAVTVQRLAHCGSLLGDDLLFGIGERLADIESSGTRSMHLVIQVPRELMRYPWELLRDRRGWLVERFAIGRQVIAEADTAFSVASTQRHGPLRLLVVAPAIDGQGAELGGVGALEGEHVAGCFERLLQRLPGLVEPMDFRAYVGKAVTVDRFRALLRDGRYDIVHFAGHGRYDPQHPERSSWTFSDGPLYAFELRHTLANAQVTPWLVYGNACEAARESDGGAYHNGMYGMASAALGQGVAAYVAPLWRITDTDAKNLAAAFYEALLLRRTSLGEALALARRSVKVGEPDLDELTARMEMRATSAIDDERVRSAGWTGMALYGDPTPTVLQRLSPADGGVVEEERVEEDL